jgi:hypothetical protein
MTGAGAAMPSATSGATGPRCGAFRAGRALRVGLGLHHGDRRARVGGLQDEARTGGARNGVAIAFPLPCPCRRGQARRGGGRRREGLAHLCRAGDDRNAQDLRHREGRRDFQRERAVGGAAVFVGGAQRVARGGGGIRRRAGHGPRRRDAETRGQRRHHGEAQNVAVGGEIGGEVLRRDRAVLDEGEGTEPARRHGRGAQGRGPAEARLQHAAVLVGRGERRASAAGCHGRAGDGPGGGIDPDPFRGAAERMGKGQARTRCRAVERHAGVVHRPGLGRDRRRGARRMADRHRERHRLPAHRSPSARARHRRRPRNRPGPARCRSCRRRAPRPRPRSASRCRGRSCSRWRHGCRDGPRRRRARSARARSPPSRLAESARWRS